MITISWNINVNLAINGLRPDILCFSLFSVSNQRENSQQNSGKQRGLLARNGRFARKIEASSLLFSGKTAKNSEPRSEGATACGDVRKRGRRPSAPVAGSGVRRLSAL
jgi:hypothetical protein